MRRSESSSVLQRYNSRRKSSISGGRTASASMIGTLTPKSLSSMKDSSKKEKSTWSRIFSPLTFGFEKKDFSYGREESSYNLSRRRTHDYSKTCPSFHRKGSLRPSPNTQVRDRNTSNHEDNRSSLQLSTSGTDLNLDNDILGLNDLSSCVFEPVLGQISKSNNISRVQAFSQKDTTGHIQRSKTAGFFKEDKKTNIYNVLRILRFHDGISGKTYKSLGSRTTDSGGDTDLTVKRKITGTGSGIGLGSSTKNTSNDTSDNNFIEIEHNQIQFLNKNNFTANRNTSINAALSNKEFIQGDIPYCDTILYLDDPKPKEYDTSFSKLHDNSFYKDSFNNRFE
ncbi:uncharacterized protein cubi_02520 [Cryptosporidium ubiquitum]|uniref:Uncharacterized protein n=1 Tax=Cryptosporidium ubiquitum TaxID=857276 RepID=A0A1J4MGF7_9CRYT|nr:uncharacterized protein cubi_02520 [Cryptosporidium ubiquitum]OII73288.1 hypothetical protein cubi_02520 [Cryptosporidium ubiquitum]